MVSVVDSNTTALTVGTTPDTLSTQTAAGSYQLTADFNTLADDEEVWIILQRKVLTGGTVRDAYVEKVRGTLSTPIVISVPISSGFGVTVKMNQRNGSSRSVDWELLKLDA